MTARWLITVACMAWVAGSNAQAPGYLGKVNLVTYSINLNPAIAGLNLFSTLNRTGYRAYRNQSSPGFSVLSRHQVEFERAYSRSSSFGLGAFITRTAEAVNIYQSSEVDHATVGSQTVGLFPTIKVFMRGRGSIAPVGAYIKLAAGVMRTSFHTDLIVDSAARAEVVPLAKSRPDVFGWVSLGDAIAISSRVILTFAIDIGWGGGLRLFDEGPLQPPAGRAMMPSFQIGVSRTL